MSTMLEDFTLHGIALKATAAGKYKGTCPRCKEKTLQVHIISENLAEVKCGNCYWKATCGDPAQKSYAVVLPEQVPLEPKPKQEKYSEQVTAYFARHKIPEEVLFRNRLYVDDANECLQIPYYVDGQLFNVKRRQGNRDTWEREFRQAFYGLDDLTSAETIIVVQDEMDKFALEACGLFSVIAVPEGCYGIEEDMPVNEDEYAYMATGERYFTKAKAVYIAMQDDRHGDRLREELVRRIGVAKSFVIKFPNSSALLTLKELGTEAIHAAIHAAKAIPIQGLYSVDVMHNDLVEYYNHGMTGGVSTGFENVDKIYTVKKRQTDVVTGIPNSGKTEWLDAVRINLSKNENWKHAIFSPEGVKEDHISFLIEKLIGLPAAPDEPNRMSIDQFMNGAEWINKYFYFIRADDEDALPTLDYVLERANAAIMRYGVDSLTIDPWNELEHNMPKDMNETTYIGKALARLGRWTKNHDVKTWIVAHPTKIYADKDGKVRVPSLYDIFGSSNWANKIDNGIAIHRVDDASSMTEVHVKKSRSKYVGKKGMVSLKYDRATGRYSVPADHAKFDKVNSDDEEIKTWAV